MVKISKRKFWFVLFIVILCLVGCDSKSNQLQALNLQINSLENQNIELGKQLEVFENNNEELSNKIISLKEENVLLENDNKKTINQLNNEIKNLEKENEQHVRSFENTEDKVETEKHEYLMKSDHYHFSESHGDKVCFIIQKDYGISDNSTDELWRYDASGKGKKLYAKKGLDFRVNNDNTQIAIIGYKKLVFLDADGKITKEIEKNELNSELTDDVYIEPIGWAKNGQNLWVKISFTTDVYYFIKINIKTWEISSFENTLPFQGEYILNIETGWIAYSDYPKFYDVDSRNEFQQTDEIISLNLYNLYTKETIEVDKAKTNQFKPEWIGDKNEIGYYIGSKFKSFSFERQGK